MAWGDNDVVLAFTVMEPVPAGTSVHQADDGTLFYYKYREPERLYVKWQDEEIDVKLSEEKAITKIGEKLIHGNSIYFTVDGKGETITFGGICSRVQGGKKYVYRLCDDPYKNGIAIDATTEQLTGFELRGIHRGKAVYLNTRSGREPCAYILGDNVIAIQCILGTTPFMRDSSRLIYLTNQQCVFALDSELALFRPLLSCGDHPIRTIVSVISGVLTVRARKYEADSQEYLMTAKLPERYYDKA